MRPGALKRRRTPRLAAAGSAGTLTLFTAITAIGLLASVTAIVDASQKMAARAEAQAVAEEAARAGAGQVNRSQAYSRGGPFTVDPAAGLAAARAYLSHSGHTGTVVLTGGRAIRVTVTVSKPAMFATMTSTQTAAARLVSGVTGPGA